MQYPTCNDAGILVLNSNPDSHSFPGCAEQAQTDFEIISKSNLPSKQTREIIAQCTSVSMHICLNTKNHNMLENVCNIVINLNIYINP